MAEFSKIKENYVFSRVYRKGKSQVDPLLVTYALPARDGGIRIGITTSKKIGNAVTRSRARRVILAAFRENLPLLSGNWEIVFVARSRTPHQKSTQLTPVMLSHLSQLGCRSEKA